MDLFDVYPLFDIEPVKARGSYLWDKNGTAYLDFYGGHAVISIGHSHPHYVEKIHSQLQKIGFYSNSVLNSLQLELANKLGRLSGYNDYRLFLVNSGAEANENAIKLASFHTGRKKIVSFSGAFHGRTAAAVAATDNPTIVAPVNRSEHFVILPFNDIPALEAYFKAQGKETAAVIIEGIQGVAGAQVPETAFLEKIRELCNNHGACMILDEVQSGFGRSGKFFAHQWAGTHLRPDIITMAKGMGNGFPIGGVLIHPDIQAKYGLLGTTFGGNHLACAAAIAVLEVIEEEDLLENARQTGEYLTSRLNEAGTVRKIRGKGLMIGIELNEPCAALRKQLLAEHRIFTGSSADKHTMRLLPALNIGREETDRFLEAFIEILDARHEIRDPDTRS